MIEKELGSYNIGLDLKTIFDKNYYLTPAFNMMQEKISMLLDHPGSYAIKILATEIIHTQAQEVALEVPKHEAKIA